MTSPRPALFKWRHFEPEIILCAVRWYLRFSLSCRDVEEFLIERALPADHTTIWRWLQRYAPETQPALPPGIEADQRFLGSGRNLYLCGWEMAIPISSGRFHRRHDRFLAFCKTGSGRSQALLPESFAVSPSSPSAGNQCRRLSVLPEGDHGTASMPMPNVSMPEQYRGTGPSRDQTARECEPRVPILRWCVADDSRL